MTTTSKQGDHSAAGPDLQSSPSEQAKRCRRLAQSTLDRSTAEMLDQMADDFDRQALAARG